MSCKCHILRKLIDEADGYLILGHIALCNEDIPAYQNMLGEAAKCIAKTGASYIDAYEHLCGAWAAICRIWSPEIQIPKDLFSACPSG